MSRLIVRRRTRRLFFTAAAVIICLAGLEIAARVREIDHPGAPVDARSLLAFQALPQEPLLASDETTGGEHRYLTSGDWPGLPLAVNKPPDEIRIVILGGSQALGYGVAMPANFGRVMERLLNKAASPRRVRVINLSRIGYASPQHAANLSRNIAALAPDLVITVMGNNEFLDAHATLATERLDRLLLARWLENRSALARLLRPPLLRRVLQIPQKPPPSDVKMTRVRDFVQDRLTRSVRQIAETARGAGAKVLVCTAAVNHRFLNGNEWFFTQNADSSSMDRDFLEAYWALRYGVPDKAAALMRERLRSDESDFPARLVLALTLTQEKQPAAARAEYEAIANGIGPDMPSVGRFGQVYLRTAGICGSRSAEECRREASRWMQGVKDAPAADRSFRLWQNGELLLLTGDADAARDAFRRAVAMEPDPLRADDGINGTLIRAAREAGAESYDLAAEAARRSPGGIPGFEWFLDYCHFNPRGHILTGALIAREAARVLRISGPVTDPETLLAREFELRRGRTTDVPEWEWWAGADFDPTLLVRGMIDGDRHPYEEILRYMKEHGESPLGRTFIGNWLVFQPSRSTEDVGGDMNRQYTRALELDPEFSAARHNMEILSAVKVRSWSPPTSQLAEFAE